MPTATGTINLDWVRRCDGALGIANHSLSNAASITLLSRNISAGRGYELIMVMAGDEPDQPKAMQCASFALETIHKAACAPDADFAYALTDSDVYILRRSGTMMRRIPLNLRYGDRYLDLQAAVADPRRTIAVVTESPAGDSATVTLVECPDGADGDIGRGVRQLWSRSWPGCIQAASVSASGDYISLALQTGELMVFDRQKKIVWQRDSILERIVIAMAVDNSGAATTLEQGGIIVHYDAVGETAWRRQLPLRDGMSHGDVPTGHLAVDADGRWVLCGVNASDPTGAAGATFAVLSAGDGEIQHEDDRPSPITGVSLAPSGRFGVLSFMNADIALISTGHERTDGEDQDQSDGFVEGRAWNEPAHELLLQAQAAFTNYNFAKAIVLLTKLAAHDPALQGSGSLWEDATWSLRETVLADTRTVSHASLARVEAALELMPQDERLLVRRNALARLVAEGLAREAGECNAEGRYEEAIAKLTEALRIDRNQSDLRNALRATRDQLALSLLRQADLAFHEERFEEAISLLERVQEVRPGEPVIAKRLEQAKGLRAYAMAMRLYIQKRYADSIGWFQQTLTYLPDHTEAERFMQFAIKFNAPGQPGAYLAQNDGEPSKTR